MESLLLLVIDGAPTQESVGIARRDGVATFVAMAMAKRLPTYISCTFFVECGGL